MNVQAEFDQLVNKLTTAINKVFADAADRETAKDPNSTYMRDPATGQAYTIFNTMTGSTDPADFSVENIIINGTIKQAPSLLGFKKPDGKIDQETADILKDIFTEEAYTLNPNLTKAGRMCQTAWSRTARKPAATMTASSKNWAASTYSFLGLA